MKTTPTKTRFSFLRFSVRFMLIVVFLAVCVLGWLSWKIQTAKAERQLALELEAAGCVITLRNFEAEPDPDDPFAGSTPSLTPSLPPTLSDFGRNPVGITTGCETTCSRMSTA